MAASLYVMTCRYTAPHRGESAASRALCGWAWGGEEGKGRGVKPWGQTRGNPPGLSRFEGTYLRSRSLPRPRRRYSGRVPSVRMYITYIYTPISHVSSFYGWWCPPPIDDRSRCGASCQGARALKCTPYAPAYLGVNVLGPDQLRVATLARREDLGDDDANHAVALLDRHEGAQRLQRAAHVPADGAVVEGLRVADGEERPVERMSVSGHINIYNDVVGGPDK
jgi:hypothetical protein